MTRMKAPKHSAAARRQHRSSKAKPGPVSHQIPAAQFKARCLALMDRVRERREEYVITKHGRPVAKLVPVEEEGRDPWGWMKGTVLSYGDLISPIDVEWEADRDD